MPLFNQLLHATWLYLTQKKKNLVFSSIFAPTKINTYLSLTSAASISQSSDPEETLIEMDYEKEVSFPPLPTLIGNKRSPKITKKVVIDIGWQREVWGKGKNKVVMRSSHRGELVIESWEWSDYLVTSSRLLSRGITVVPWDVLGNLIKPMLHQQYRKMKITLH